MFSINQHYQTVGRLLAMYVLGCSLIAYGKTPSVFSDPHLEQVLKSYTFINDFRPKPPLRPIGPELFWKYPLQSPPAQFEFLFDIGLALDEMLPTTADARWAEHMNRGRKFYVDGSFEEAKKTWLSLKARYGNDYPY